MIDVVSFGEVLWDVIDGVPHIGGAPFNFAAHVAGSGLSVALVSSVGDDGLGRLALEKVNEHGVDGRFVAVHPSLPTGTVNVSLRDGIPSYEIVRPVAWDEIMAETGEFDEPPRAFYFGTLAQRSPASARTLRMLLHTFYRSLTFFDVNLRAGFWNMSQIEEGLSRTDVLKVNDEEMAEIGLVPDALFRDKPRLKVVVETRGADGCAVWSREGETFVSPAVSDGPVVDTVGAGDAFSAAFLGTLLRGHSLKEAAHAGNVLAGKVASRVGAVPEDFR